VDSMRVLTFHLKILLNNYMKTTALGILTIVATLANVGVQVLKGGNPDFMGAIAALTAGFGLVKAQDHRR